MAPKKTVKREAAKPARKSSLFLRFDQQPRAGRNFSPPRIGTGASKYRPDFAESLRGGGSRRSRRPAGGRRLACVCGRQTCGGVGSGAGRGTSPRGRSLTVNLEPCSHQGRTGPCADAIIAAGIRRVVASMQDPNPLVAAKGFERLRNAGISVASGILEDEAKTLNEPFAKFIRCQTPLVTLKAAMTLDGKIAPPPSEPHSSTALGGGGGPADG